MREVFRPLWILPLIMGAAGVLWAGVLVYLLTFDGVPFGTLGGAAFFVAFFGLSLWYYARSAIVVDAKGLTYRGILRTEWLPWTEIRTLDVMPGPVTVYAIRAGSTLCHFTSFFRHHKRLAMLLVERAGLATARV
jgi:Bacterial PH domain